MTGSPRSWPNCSWIGRKTTDATSWTILKPTEMKTETGAKLELKQDGSVFAHHRQPFQNDTYTLVFSTEGKSHQVPAVWKSWPTPACLRADRGGVRMGISWLNELTLEAAPAESPGEAKVIAVTKPLGRFQQRPDGFRRLAMSRERSMARTARAGPSSPNSTRITRRSSSWRRKSAGGQAWRLTVRLIHQSFHQNRDLGNLGRFRLSVSASPGRSCPGTETRCDKEARQSLGQACRRLSRHRQAAGRPSGHRAASRGSSGHGRPFRGRARLGGGDRRLSPSALADDPADTALMTRLATAYQAAGRTREAVPLLAAASSANPKNTLLSLKVAALQAWFGQDKELAVTRQRILALAQGTEDAMTAARAAKACSIRPSGNKAEHGRAARPGWHGGAGR